MNNNNFPFKEGDWIVSNDEEHRHVGLIKSLKGDICLFADGNGMYQLAVEEDYHSWTIEDAQDGDVLTASIHHWEIRGDIENLPVRVPTIFMYREVKTDNKNIYAYVSLFDNTSLDIYNRYYIDEYGIKDVHPATSEQCNLLWQKMKETGCKWDPFAKEIVKSSFKLKETLLSASDRGIIDEIILALGSLGAEKMISYDKEIKFLERIRKL